MIMMNVKAKNFICPKPEILLKLHLLIAICGIMLCGSLSLYAQEIKNDYHNFKVDFSQVKDSPQIDRITKAVERQIEIVEQVKLSEENLNFFKSVPVVMVPNDAGTPGVYSAAKKTVFLKAKDLAANRPILLHEFLHAYHHQKITDGMRNQQIRAFYEQAVKQFSNYQNEYFLSNAGEFFAVTASIYLFGDIPRPPFNLSEIKKAQPDYYQYLKALFGEHK